MIVHIEDSMYVLEAGSALMFSASVHGIFFTIPLFCDNFDGESLVEQMCG